MPDSKTIEIDEIVTAEKSASDDTSSPNGTSSSSSAPPFQSDNPLADLEKSLPWKARWTLRLTRWFILLRSKSWGKLVITLAVILGILLAIPLGIIFLSFLIIRSLLRPLFR